MTWALSGLILARTPAFVAIGSCREIISFAFFIGWTGVGEGFGRFGNWGAFTVGDGPGRGGVRRGICALAVSLTARTRATIGMRRRQREVTTNQLPTYVSTR